MALKAKKKSKLHPEHFEILGRTQGMLSEIWDLWKKNLGHTPDAVKKQMTAGIKEIHKAEKAILKKATSTKKSSKKKSSPKKSKTTKRKAK